MTKPLTLAEKLEHLAALARKNPGDPHAIKWRLLYVVAEIDANNPSPSFIDDLLGKPKVVQINRKDAA